MSKEDKIAGLTRKEFLALPMEERHRRLAEQAKRFVKEHGYLPDDPCDGHSTMIQPKPEPVNYLNTCAGCQTLPQCQCSNIEDCQRGEPVKEVMPRLTIQEYMAWRDKHMDSPLLGSRFFDFEAQRDADMKVLEAKEKEWATIQHLKGTCFG